MFRIVQRRVRAAIRQEPYLGFSALGDVYLAGNAEQLPPAPTTQSRDLADKPKKEPLRSADHVGEAPCNQSCSFYFNECVRKSARDICALAKASCMNLAMWIEPDTGRWFSACRY
jgi:hypothetical protein